MNNNFSVTGNFKIREADIEDIESVKLIELEAGLSSWTIVEYRKELVRKDSIFLVCEFNKAIIGFLLARLITKYTSNQETSYHFDKKYVAGEIEIYNIAIKNDFRRSGIGSKLISKITNEYLDFDFYLEVRTSNSSAISFYKSFGFEIIGRRKNFYNLPIEDAVLMKLSLSDKKTIT